MLATLLLLKTLNFITLTLLILIYYFFKFKYIDFSMRLSFKIEYLKSNLTEETFYCILNYLKNKYIIFFNIMNKTFFYNTKFLIQKQNCLNIINGDDSLQNIISEGCALSKFKLYIFKTKKNYSYFNNNFLNFNIKFFNSVLKNNTVYNKSKYSRTRQICFNIALLGLFINILFINELHRSFYNISINWTYMLYIVGWFFIFSVCLKNILNTKLIK